MNISRTPADPGELDGVYATLWPLLLSIAYEMVGAIGEAEDIVQEKFLRFHRAVAESTDIESPKAWLSTVTTRKPAMKDTQKSAKSTTAIRKTSGRFSDEERAAMRERAQELKAEARRGPRAKKDKADGESAVLAKIAEMPEPDRALAERIHAIVRTSAPDLSPRTWYGMPAYANEDGKVVCYFTPADKFKSRYATFGFNDDANLDEGTMWPTSFALTELTAADEARIGALVKKAVS